MGKNHKHSKKLKSEKNKVQIKSKTKFLPKGQNVTNTAFKIKPIVLQEQLKERGATGGLIGKHKTNINELIGKLKHYNDVVKTEACQDLQELISGNSLDVIHIYTAAIIQNGSGLVQDKERKVRRAAVKMLNIIFEKTNDESLRPFSTYILRNLKCAMTNINKYIQEDSLLLLDAILEHKSILIAENFDDFFPNFLLLISKLKNQKSGEHCLSLNLEGKVTSVRWRVKVLSRLYGILKAMVALKENTKTEHNHKKLDFNVKGITYIPLESDLSIYENNDYALFSRTQSLTSKFDGDISNLIRLLHEIWIEVVPEKSKSNLGGTVLPTDESVAVFLCVVHIMNLLLQYVQIINQDEIFRDSKFLEQLTSNFPYTHNVKNLDILKDFPENLNFHSSCHNENLIILYVFLTSKKDCRHFESPKSVSPFVYNCFKTPQKHNLTFLMKILEMLMANPNLLRRVGLDRTEISSKISQLAFDTKTPEKVRELFRQLMSSLDTDSWGDKVAQLLSEKKITCQMIISIFDLCKKSNGVVLDVISRNLTQILGNFVSLEIDGDEEQGWRYLAFIFFYLKLTDVQVGEILCFIERNHELKICKNLKGIVRFRGFYK